MGTPDMLAKVVRKAARDMQRGHSQSALDALRAAGTSDEAVDAALRAQLCRTDGQLLAGTIGLVRALGRETLQDEVADAALRRPASMAAKRMAIRALRELGVEVPAMVHETVTLVEALCEEPTPERIERVFALPDAWREPALIELRSAPVPMPVEVVQRLLERGQVDCVPFVERLGSTVTAEAIEFLTGLAGSDDRLLRKAAKRALHQLRSSGAEFPEPAATDNFSLTLHLDVARESRAYATGVDGAGGRILWILVPTESGGNRLLEAVLDDRSGLRKAEVLEVTVKGFRAHMERLRGNEGLLIAQLEPGRAAGILAQAEELNAASETPVPPAYVDWKGGAAGVLFEHSKDAASAESSLGSEDDRRALLRQSVDLLKLPFFGNWAFVSDEVSEAARAVRAAETSELLVDDDQRKQQVDKAISGVAETIADAERVLWASRLQAMAEVLETTRRDEEARWARAAAWGFAATSDLYADHPFARAMIQRGVLAAYQHVRQHENADTAAAAGSAS